MITPTNQYTHIKDMPIQLLISNSFGKWVSKAVCPKLSRSSNKNAGGIVTEMSNFDLIPTRFDLDVVPV